MSRTKALGIDHGTSNSALAVMEGDGPRVILPNGVDNIMPSVVFIFDQGRELVGWDARNAMIVHYDKGIGEKEYKRKIGQNDDYAFCGGKKILKAPDLGARVIRALLQAYQKDVGADVNDLPKAAVVTIPAVFDQSACEGTREAARRAGLEEYPLLQEPIAASLAYGFAEMRDDAQWMVFDWGGGTLDISLVYTHNGQMDVPKEGHGGDPQLGGRDLDRRLYDYVLQELQRQYRLEGFATDEQYRRARNALMMAVEDAKIELSRIEETHVQTQQELCKDRSGKPVTVHVPITRDQYEKMIAADVEKTIHHCETLLQRNKLRPSDVHALILVGGPTKTPYVQTMLSQRLGIELRSTIDPMTAVAEGAALYAETYEWRQSDSAEEVYAAGNASQPAIRLIYQNHSQSPLCPVSGILLGLPNYEGVTVEIKAADGDWATGPISVGAEGTFACDVQLTESDKPHRCDFVTTAKNAAGEEIASRGEPQVWHPYVGTTGALKVATSLRVGVVGNQTETLVARGADLPSDETRCFETARLLRKGQAGDLLRVPVMEAVPNLVGVEDSHADACFLVGTLPIEAGDERVTCDVPVGSQIEVTLHQDESRNITVTAYVPILNEDFQATFTSSSYGVSLEDVCHQFDGVKEDLDATMQLHQRKPRPEVKVALDAIQRLDAINGVTKDLDLAKQGDRDALYRAYRHMLELRGTLHHVRELQRRGRIEARIEQLAGVVERGLEKDEHDMIRADYASCDPADVSALRRIEESLDTLDLKVRGRPYAMLALDLSALSGRRVSNDQHAIATEAGSLFDRLIEKGGPGSLTDDDLANIDRMRKKIDDAFPEIHEWRREAIEKIKQEGWGSGDPVKDALSDLQVGRGSVLRGEM